MIKYHPKTIALQIGKELLVIKLNTTMKHIEGTIWFRRFLKDVKNISSRIRIKRIKMGFYRLYYDDAYLHEVYKEMPQHGYDIYDIDPRIENQSYYEEYEDNTELTRKIKNYVEGYWDSLDRIKTRVFLMRNNKEFNTSAKNAYKNMYVK